jgi:Squalene-hopene cyclase C-terminal domain
MNDTILRGIDYLEKQHNNGYPDAVHRMWFPKSNSNPTKYDLHEGITFQRALICDTLIDLSSAGFNIDWIALMKDVQLLINSRSMDTAGGWKYFPTLRSLPPDADDLGQILQVLVRSKIDKISALVDEAIRLLLTQGKHPDGSLETWIVDKTDDSNSNRAVLKAIEDQWGKGPDVEVMANFLYGLNMYDPKRYYSELRKGCQFIIKSQESLGYWKSNWYVDRFYGTFMCTRLISVLSPNNLCLHNAYRFLVDTQTQSGGWGREEGNPLQTSLALLSLISIMLSGYTISKAILNNGINYLLRSQTEDGSWIGTPFIQMNTNRVSAQHINIFPRIITYESNTISSAFCLKALSQLYIYDIKI